MISIKMEDNIVTSAMATTMTTAVTTSLPPTTATSSTLLTSASASAPITTTTTINTFQMPVNMSTNSSTSPSEAVTATATAMTTTTTTTTTTITRNNISVTNIKCEVDEMVSTSTAMTTKNDSVIGVGTAGGSIGNVHVPVIATATTASSISLLGGHYNGGDSGFGVIGGMGGGIRIPVTKKEEDSDSETELTNIENLKVTRRMNAYTDGIIANTNSNTITSSNDDGSGVGVIVGAGIGALDLHHSGNSGNNYNKNGPRPMSWEGELSETETTETELMETENSLSSSAGITAISTTPPTLSASQASVIMPMALSAAVIKNEPNAQLAAAVAATTTTATILSHAQHHQHQHQHPHQTQHHHQHFYVTPPRAGNAAAASTLLAAHVIKAELEMDMHGGGSNLYVAPHSSSNNKVKLAPTQSDPINLKYEPSQSDVVSLAAAAATASAVTSVSASSLPHNSPLLTRNGKSSTSISSIGGSGAAALPLPANPSPDSAIHSVYTHSSPSQSPLTSRHAPYTPSLSRNNSDASHSSCYSYSSEFSPTHSPIQGRHATPAAAAAAVAAAALSYSLHHSVLYRPISLDSGVGGSVGGGVSGAGGGGSMLPTPSSSSSSMEAAHNLSTNYNNNNNNNISNNNSNSSSCGSNSNNHASSTTSSPSALGIVGGSSASATLDSLPASAAGISRQQLINSPCPICGDKISGFHYGIFSCESCKGFFKRTVQNRKNYVCVRGGPCPVSISTRKKCPACRFEKCLQKGMKLEAIREDRTRGGRSTYQCSYTLPNAMLSPLLSPEHQPMSVGSSSVAGSASQQTPSSHGGSSAAAGSGSGNTVLNGYTMAATTTTTILSPGSGGGSALKCEQNDDSMMGRGNAIFSSSALNGVATSQTTTAAAAPAALVVPVIPILLQEIMNVEHLWQYNAAELARLNQPLDSGSSCNSAGSSSSGSTSNSVAQQQQQQQQMTNPLLASAGLSNGENTNPDLIAHLCNVADHRLYKIVKWCKSLPLFKNISIDDQICLLINSWCELLLFSCCFRSIDTPGEIKMSQGKKLNLTQAKSSGLQACIERMLNLTDHLRRLRVDSYEYVAMKVIVLLQSDTSELREPVKVRECQEKALQSLQAYTLAHYPAMPSKFGELLLRIPELQRTCQLGKEMLTIKSRDGGDFNLLMELLRGEH